ncbi:hypothetical protein [Pseudodesulfovibrio pelocollis]|uniref:hypothetical protein n=1 Tax=Pseudodesulfovibrio pelocollis TaxID=3051432 RepID=UPI00255A925D|nr:hypothetical protein [Pseudodesulfovibrio sp. SB368]
MRARNIKPGFFTNEDVVECSAWARLCFIGLWALADRCGRLENRPKRIKMSLFPADAVEIEALLDELCEAGLIVRYSHEDRQYLFIPGFKKHQTPHYKEREICPACPGYEDDEQGDIQDSPPDQPQEDQDLPKTDPGPTLGQPPLNPESGILNPESGILNPEKEKNPPKPPRGGQEYSKPFVLFWELYPCKRNKQRAWRVWKGIKGVDARVIMEALARQIAADHWRGQDGREYVPHPATWLNGAGWDDEIKQRGGGMSDLPPELR